MTNNNYLRDRFLESCKDIPLVFPKSSHSLDNATMIAGLGYHVFQEEGKNALLTLEPKTRIPFSS